MMITYTREDLENFLLDFAYYLTGYSSSDPNMQENKFDKESRFYGSDWPIHSMTMIGVNRLINIQKCMFDVIERGVPGDFIETGVWRGGACIFASTILKMLKIKDRKVWVCDSFEGLPKPDPKYPIDNEDQHHTFNELYVSLEEVQKNFRLFNLLNDNVKFVKGWFCDTLPSINAKFSVVRLDGDMYSSTMDSLVNLYPKLSPGGYLIVDDYALKGAYAAVNDYRKQHHIDAPLMLIDIYSKAVYWQKPTF